MEFVTPHRDHVIRALLVDGDIDTLHMYAEFLHQARWDVEEVDDGRQALAKALATHPDVVVTEASLPGLSGFDLCRILREDASTRDIPILFVTASAFPRDLERARAAGADSVLIKPCLPDLLASEMRRLVAYSRELRQRYQDARVNTARHLAKADELLSRSRAVRARKSQLFANRMHHRGTTTKPPLEPPALVCPQCDRALKYVSSHIGGANARLSEQWDYFECPAGCGTFQYRQRTRRLRRAI